MIKPTVGRVVWFYPNSSDAELGGGSEVAPPPRAAIVAHVWSDACVNLAVFDANGKPHARTSVLLIQGDEEVQPTHGYCTWMPFQKGQAAKTEAAPAPAPSPDGPSRFVQICEGELGVYALDAHGRVWLKRLMGGRWEAL